MPLSARFEEALVYAAHLHRDQVRKATPVPYVSHLLAVASLVLEHGGTEDEAIAGLLHDAIEDQGGRKTRDEIATRFGATVVDIVEGCTDSDVEPKPAWRPRKEAYVAHIARASAATRLVSAADKLHNARSILRDYRDQGEELWARFKGGRDGTLWYYRALCDAFRQAGTSSLVEELVRTVEELERVTQRK